MNRVISILGGISLVISLLFTQSALANCRDDITASTPDQDFTLHNDGTVTHNSTGLMWMRCSRGQTWDGSTCTGVARSFYSWQDALIEAHRYSFAGHSDWRLPNKNELASLVEQRCVSPSINSMVFPNTPSKWFWSSSPYAFGSNGTWLVGFDDGRVNGFSKSNHFQVRLVRDVQTSGPGDGAGPNPRPGSKASVNLNNLSGHMLLLYSASAKAYVAAHFDGTNDLFYVAAGVSSQSQKGSAADSEGEWTVAQNKLTLTVVERTPLTITADADGSFRLGKTYQSTQGEWSVVDIYSQDEWTISDVTGYKFYFLTASSNPAETLTQIVFYPDNKLVLNGRTLKWRYTQAKIQVSEDGGTNWSYWPLFNFYNGWTFGQDHNNPLQTYFIKIEPVAVDE